ncbi:MAG: hypothetical protein LBP40_07850 [Campylobacteraceae bacterium]|nr:hypothetical protein [Campylobacteraceae bacterium]
MIKVCTWQIYLKYFMNGFEITGGKQNATSPYSEPGYNSSRDNGLLALYKDILDWTFAGLAFLQTRF